MRNANFGSRSFFSKWIENCLSRIDGSRACISLTTIKIGTRCVHVASHSSIDRFHLTSRRPYWCTKTMKWRPYWCTVRELALSSSNISYCFTTPLGPPITWVKTIYMRIVDRADKAWYLKATLGLAWEKDTSQPT